VVAGGDRHPRGVEARAAAVGAAGRRGDRPPR
jgi:hypothetical protein